MRWHTEECRQAAWRQSIMATGLFAEAECLPECDQKWRAFMRWLRGQWEYVPIDEWEKGFFDATMTITRKLDLEEEVNDNVSP